MQVRLHNKHHTVSCNSTLSWASSGVPSVSPPRLTSYSRHWNTVNGLLCGNSACQLHTRKQTTELGHL